MHKVCLLKKQTSANILLLQVVFINDYSVYYFSHQSFGVESAVLLK